MDRPYIRVNEWSTGGYTKTARFANQQFSPSRPTQNSCWRTRFLLVFEPPYSLTRNKEINMPIIYRFMWNNREVVITYKPKTFDAFERIYGTPLSHLAIECEEPLPISDTGFKSHYIANSALLEYGGPLEFVKRWLDEDAETKAWKAYDAKSRQLSLF